MNCHPSFQSNLAKATKNSSNDGHHVPVSKSVATVGQMARGLGAFSQAAGKRTPNHYMGIDGRTFNQCGGMNRTFSMLCAPRRQSVRLSWSK